MPGDPDTWEVSGSLFNMIEDPFESHNLYKDYPEVVQEMNGLLRKYLEGEASAYK